MMKNKKTLLICATIILAALLSLLVLLIPRDTENSEETVSGNEVISDGYIDEPYIQTEDPSAYAPGDIKINPYDLDSRTFIFYRDVDDYDLFVAYVYNAATSFAIYDEYADEDVQDAFDHIMEIAPEGNEVFLSMVLDDDNKLVVQVCEIKDFTTPVYGVTLDAVN